MPPPDVAVFGRPGFYGLRRPACGGGDCAICAQTRNGSARCEAWLKAMRRAGPLRHGRDVRSVAIILTYGNIWGSLMQLAVQSQRRRYPQSGIDGRGSQLLRAAAECGARSPLVHDLGRRPVDGRFPGRVLDACDFGCVLEHISAWRLEIGKRVVAGCVPAGAPTQLHVLLQQTPYTAHHLIETTHFERGVIEACR